MVLLELTNSSNVPWVIMGDFNDLLSKEEKSGGIPHPNWLYQGFRKAIVDSNLSDISMTSHKLTWSRDRWTVNFLDERLDRAITNPRWHSRFASTTLTNVAAPIYDHTRFPCHCCAQELINEQTINNKGLKENKSQ